MLQQMFVQGVRNLQPADEWSARRPHHSREFWLAGFESNRYRTHFDGEKMVVVLLNLRREA